MKHGPNETMIGKEWEKTGTVGGTNLFSPADANKKKETKGIYATATLSAGFQDPESRQREKRRENKFKRSRFAPTPTKRTIFTTGEPMTGKKKREKFQLPNKGNLSDR